MHELVIDLNSCQMQYEFKAYMIHVSGTRMIKQRTDGVSRGDVKQALLIGRPLRDLIPIDESALERWSRLKDWLKILAWKFSRLLATRQMVCRRASYSIRQLFFVS